MLNLTCGAAQKVTLTSSLDSGTVVFRNLRNESSFIDIDSLDNIDIRHVNLKHRKSSCTEKKKKAHRLL